MLWHCHLLLLFENRFSFYFLLFHGKICFMIFPRYFLSASLYDRYVFIFSFLNRQHFSPKSLKTVMATMKLKNKQTNNKQKHLLLGRKAVTNLDSIFKSRGITLLQKPYRQSNDFFSIHVWMWELDHKEGCVLKNWCFQIVVLEKTLESPLDCKNIKPVNSNQSILKEINPEYSLERCWSWSSNTLANWCEEITHWERPWC